MTRVEFHIIQSAAQLAADSARFSVLDGLLSSALAGGTSVHIHACSAADKNNLHKRYHHYLQHTAQLTICHISEPVCGLQVLFNLAPDVPHFFSRFRKTVEIIDTDEKCKALGRERYQFYRERGYPLTHCKVLLKPSPTPVQLSLT